MVNNLATGYQKTSQGIDSGEGTHGVTAALRFLVEVKHWNGRAEELREVMEEHEAVSDDVDGNVLKEVVLHGYLRWEPTGVDGFTGGPSHSVRRTTRHVSYLLVCTRRKNITKESIWLLGQGRV